jgi:hypothetical protein
MVSDESIVEPLEQAGRIEVLTSLDPGAGPDGWSPFPPGLTSRDGEFELVDPEAGSERRRYFRLVEQP